MLGMLNGTVAEVYPSFCFIDVNGLGYRINTHPRVLADLVVGKKCRMYLHEQIREDIYELYGFIVLEELEFFKQLIGVSGIGPKVGLAICASGPISEIKQRLSRGEVEWLSSIPGIGKKTAQKVILELKGKLVDADGGEMDMEIVEALTALGYPVAQARKASKDLPPDVTETSERIRLALKSLAR